jgi:hypothetical protein
MKLKPSVLDQFSGERAVEPPAPRSNYTSSSDSVILEDESGRVALCAGEYEYPAHSPAAGRKAILPMQRLIESLVTGVVIAILGSVTETGELAVEDICVPGFATGFETSPEILKHPLRYFNPGFETNIGKSPPTHKPFYVLLVSGLAADSRSNQHSEGRTNPVALQLLSDYVSGMAGNENETRESTSRIVRVIIAGGLIGRPALTAASAAKIAAAASASSSAMVSSTQVSGLSGSSSSFFSDRNISIGEQEAATEALREADAFLTQFAASVPVDVMPGESEPANHMLPQQPLHACLFPLAGRLSSVHAVTNPYSCEFNVESSITSVTASVEPKTQADNRSNIISFLGSSGQPVIDILRYSSNSSLMTPGDEFGLLEGLTFDAPLVGNNKSGQNASNVLLLSSSSSSSAAAASESAAVSMDIDKEEGGGGGGGGMLSASSSIVLNEGEDMLAAKGESVADVLMVTSRAIDVQGTGAGAGADERMRAGAGGDEIVDKMSELDVLTNTLFWRMLAPTAPDSLTCFPFTETDPFVIRDIPSVFFSGGCKSFGTRLIVNKDNTQRVRVICVPEFSSTHTAVLVDVNSPILEAKALRFDVHE